MPQERTSAKSGWAPTQVYITTAVCVLVGILAGYLVHGPAQAATATSAGSSASAAAVVQPQAQSQPSPEALKKMAASKAEPLLGRLKTSPNDPQLLAELANVYDDAREFGEAISYYKRSLAVQENPDVRTDLGTTYFYAGDPDAAVREFQAVLRSNPSHANALFDLGVVRWQGKLDINGAVAAWQQLLKTNPNHPRRAEVQQLIARARQHAGMTPGMKTDKPAM